MVDFSVGERSVAVGEAREEAEKGAEGDDAGGEDFVWEGADAVVGEERIEELEEEDGACGEKSV